MVVGEDSCCHHQFHKTSQRGPQKQHPTKMVLNATNCINWIRSDPQMYNPGRSLLRTSHLLRPDLAKWSAHNPIIPNVQKTRLATNKHLRLTLAFFRNDSNGMKLYSFNERPALVAVACNKTRKHATMPSLPERIILFRRMAVSYSCCYRFIFRFPSQISQK